MTQSICEGRSQTVRCGDCTVQIQTLVLQGIECLCLQDVQQRFPLVTTLCIDDVQQSFLCDEHGERLKPLRIVARVDKVIEGIEPMEQLNNAVCMRFDRLDENMRQLQRTSDLTLANTQEMLKQIKHVMTQMFELQEYTTPRFFFVLPAKHCDLTLVNDAQNLFQLHYKLYFLCECSDDPAEMHLAPHPGYSIKKPSEFMAKYGTYLETTLKIVQALVVVGGIALPYLDKPANAVGNVLGIQANDIETWRKKIPKLSFSPESAVSTATGTLSKVNKQYRAASSIPNLQKSQAAPLQGAELRQLQSYLTFIDDQRSLGNLYRTFTADGHVRWLCLEHYDSTRYIKEIEKYISQMNAMGGTYNQQSHEVFFTGVNLTSKNVKTLCEALSKGFNILQLVFQECSLNEDDLDKLLDIVSNISSISVLEMTKVSVRNFFGMLKYKCEHMITEFSNQLFKVRFNDCYQEGNTQILDRLLFHNKIREGLDFSACDFLGHERDFRQCLDANGKVTELIVEYCNNINIVNSLSKFKKLTLNKLKLHNSLLVSSILSQFCSMLDECQTLLAIDIMNQTGFDDETFIVQLLTVLRKHDSIKHLSLHIRGVQPSDEKEAQLINSLRNDQFISRLCLSESVISHELTQALVYASQERRILTHLEFYTSQINDDDVCQLELLYSNGSLEHWIFSKRTRWHETLEEINGQLQKSKSFRSQARCSKI